MEQESTNKPVTPQLEQCAGCGILSPKHPMIAVVSTKRGEDGTSDVPEGVQASEPNERGFVSIPVCDACWKDPTHRARQIKGHFFFREAQQTAVQHAGSNAIGGV